MPSEIGNGRFVVRGTEILPSDSASERLQKLARITLDEMYQLVGVLDTDGTLLECSRAALEGGGLTREEVIGRPFWETMWWTVTPKTQEDLRDAIKKAAQGEFIRYDVEVFARKSGKEIMVMDFTLRPVRDEEGRVVLLLPEGRDMTEKKMHEREIARKNLELAHLGRVAILGEMSGALAHELRQPLMAIRSYAQGSLRFIHNEADLHRVNEGLEAILRAEEHAAGVIDRVRALLKRNEPPSEELNINEIVRETLELATVQLQGRGVMLITNFGAGHLTVLGNRIELQQVLMNVIVNGCEAMAGMVRPERRLVVTTTVGAAEEVQVQVRDEGTGIPEDRVDRIFEPFVTTKKDGLGLGLAICRSILQSHGGEIRALNNSDRGSTFRICLPRTSPGISTGGASTLGTTKV